MVTQKAKRPKQKNIQSGSKFGASYATVPSGYSFKAWIGTDNTDYTDKAITSNVTLIAQFSKIETISSGGTKTTTINAKDDAKTEVTKTTDSNGNETITTVETDASGNQTTKTEESDGLFAGYTFKLTKLTNNEWL